MASCNCLKIGTQSGSSGNVSSLYTAQRPGLYVDLVWLICEALRTNCVYIPHYGPIGNVTQQTGFYGELMKGTFNMTDPEFVPTVERKDYFSMPNYFFLENPDGIFVTRKTATSHYSATSFLGPFANSTWLAIVISIFSVSLAVEFGNGGNLKDVLSRVCVTSLDLLVYLARKGPRILTKRKASKIVLIVWGVAALNLIMAFSSGLLSSLLSGEKTLSFHSFETLADCIEEDRCSFAFLDDEMWFYRLAKLQTNPAYSRFWKAVSRREIQIESTFEVSLETVRSQLDKFHVTGPVGSGLLSEHLGRKCDLLLVRTDISTASTVLLRKGDPFVNQLNDVLMYLEEVGLFEAIQKRYQLEPTCDWFGVIPDTRKGAPMPLAVMFGPVVILLIGFAAGLISLAAERVTAFTSSSI